MLDQLYPYSKQIISYNYQPEDKFLNVFLMIVLWLAGVKSASQGQRLKMSLFLQILQARMLSFLSYHVQRSHVWCPVNESSRQRSYIFTKKNAKLKMMNGCRGTRWMRFGDKVRI